MTDRLTNDRDRLTECGFRLAEVSFRGVADRELWFATRQDRDSGKNHWFAVDLVAGTVDRWTKNGATRSVWSIDEACELLSLGSLSAENLSFTDRCTIAGFVKLLPSSTHSQVPNYWGSMGNGSKWLLCERSEKLIRFDVQPWETWQLIDCRMQRVDHEARVGDFCLMEAVSPAAIEQKSPSPQKTQAPPRSTEPYVWTPVEHSGASVQESLF